MPVNERTLTTKCIKKGREWAVKEEVPLVLAKIHAGPHQPIGLPDVIGCCCGVFVAIEMKAPGKERTLTERQEKKLRDIKNAEGVTAVCTSWAQFLAVLEEAATRGYEGE